MTGTTAGRGASAAAAAAAAVLILGACSGGTDDGGIASAGGEANPATAETEDTESLDEDAQALVFAECMRDNGVDMPDPGPGQEGLVGAFRAIAGDHDRVTLDQAFLACQDLLPQFSEGEQHRPDDDFVLDVAQCLREQGLDVSDNPFEDAHGGAIDQDEFIAAMEECRNVVGGGR